MGSKIDHKLLVIFLCLKFKTYFSAEWETRDGTFVALGNKMYQGFDPKSGSTKKSTKGIPHINDYTMES